MALKKSLKNAKLYDEFVNISLVVVYNCDKLDLLLFYLIIR
jgi:hypothetical protein